MNLPDSYSTTSATSEGDGGPGSSDRRRVVVVVRGAGVRWVSWPEGDRAEDTVDETVAIALRAEDDAAATGDDKSFGSLKRI